MPQHGPPLQLTSLALSLQLVPSYSPSACSTESLTIPKIRQSEPNSVSLCQDKWGTEERVQACSGGGKRQCPRWQLEAPACLSSLSKEIEEGRHASTSHGSPPMAGLKMARDAGYQEKSVEKERNDTFTRLTFPVSIELCYHQRKQKKKKKKEFGL